LKQRIASVPSFLIRHRIVVWVIFLALTLLSIMQLPKLQVNNDIEIWVGKSGEEYNAYNEFTDQFGHDETIILMLHSDSLFTTPLLGLNYRLTDSLAAVNGVRSVISLASVVVPTQSLMGTEMVPLIPKTTGRPAKIQERVLRYSMFRDHLVSSDGKTTALTIVLDSVAEMEQVYDLVQDVAHRVIRDEVEHLFFGIVPMKAEINRLSTTESATYMIVAVVVMLLLNYLFFRRIRLAIVPIVIALITITWTLALMAVAGITINIVMSAMPLILLVVSIAFAIHFLSAMVRVSADGLLLKEAVAEVFKRTFRNCLFSAVTTAIALAVFVTSGITPLIHFGIFASAGVMIAFVITFVMLPVLYGSVSFKYRTTANIQSLDRRFSVLSRWIYGNKKWIYIGSMVMLILSLAGISRLGVNTDQETYLKKSNPVRINNQRVGEWFGGIIPMELLFHVHEGIFADPGLYMKRFQEVEEVLSRIPEIKSWQSPMMMLEDIRADHPFFDPGMIDSSMVKGNEMLSNFISDDGKSIRITIKTAWMSDNEILALMEKIEQEMELLFQDSGVNSYFTGAMPIFALMGKRLVDSQVRSVLFAFVLIFLAFLMLYGDIRWALLALIPNVLPVAGTLGLMGFLNIPIDVATVLITAVSFGIAIDDTIHFTGTFRAALPGLSRFQAVERTFFRVGSPLVATSTLLICGFLMLAMSSYRPIIFLGVFISLNIFLALFYDLILLPAILMFQKEK
jgi:uncharacterized protein